MNSLGITAYPMLLPGIDHHLELDVILEKLVDEGLGVLGMNVIIIGSMHDEQTTFQVFCS